MSEAPSSIAPPDGPPQSAPGFCARGAADARAQQRLALLRELSEIGMRLARGVEGRAEAPDAGDVGLVFSRIARAVRQTLALEARLEEEHQARARKAAFEREQAAVRAAHAPVVERSAIVRRAVVQAIEADADEDDFEQLFDQLDERLDDREADEDYLDRPLGELVARICQDLGVAVDLSLWEDEAWARAEAAARMEPAPAEACEAAPAHDPPRRHVRPAVSPGWLSG